MLRVRDAQEEKVSRYGWWGLILRTPEIRSVWEKRLWENQIDN